MRYSFIFLLLSAQVNALPQYFDAVPPTQINGAVHAQIEPVIQSADNIGLDTAAYCEQVASLRGDDYRVQRVAFNDNFNDSSNEGQRLGSCELQSPPIYAPAKQVIQARFASNVIPSHFRGVSYNETTIYQYCDSQVRTVSSISYDFPPENVTLGTTQAVIRCYSTDTAVRPQWFYHRVNIEGVQTLSCDSGTLIANTPIQNACFIGTESESHAFEIVTTITPPSVQCPDDYPELDEQAQLCTTTGASSAPYITQQLQSDSTNGAFKHLPLAISGFVATAALGLGVYQLAGRFLR